jgi:hypothetical protein
MRYIDAERLKAEIEKGTPDKVVLLVYRDIILSLIDSLQQEETDMGEVSDGYHTFNELYYYRMLYNAAFFNLLPEEWVHKSKKHHDGEECFGGGWFIVMANLPTGQISNHYELKYWDLFKVPEKEIADEWDGHTPQEAAERLYKYLQEEQLDIDEIKREWYNKGYLKGRKESSIPARELGLPKSCDMSEQSKVDLEKETIIDYVHNHYHYDKDFDGYGHSNLRPVFTREDLVELARHFYELGLNSRKENNH